VPTCSAMALSLRAVFFFIKCLFYLFQNSSGIEFPSFIIEIQGYGCKCQYVHCYSDIRQLIDLLVFRQATKLNPPRDIPADFGESFDFGTP
jgi:hypothetical protein